MRGVLAAVLLQAAATQTGSCDPASLDAAGVTPGDGGFFYGSGDASIFVPKDVIDNPMQPRELPEVHDLCKSYVGDYSDGNNYPKEVGTWKEDVKKYILGQPAPNAETLDFERANLRYSFYKLDEKAEGGRRQIQINLTFEMLPAVTLQAGGDGQHGPPWPDPYFLNGIAVTGMDPLRCWDWTVRRAVPEYYFVACDQCHNLWDLEYNICQEEYTPDCYN